MEAVASVKTGWIYALCNKVNEKVYVGQTKTGIETRFNQHVSDAKNGSFAKIHCAMRKNGIENFYMEPLEEVPVDQLDEREAFWVEQLDSFENGYNSTPNGQGPKANATTKRGSIARSAFMKEHMKAYELEKQNAILSKRLEIVESGKAGYDEIVSQSYTLAVEYKQKYESANAYIKKLEGILSNNLTNMTFSEFFRCKRAVKKAQA